MKNQIIVILIICAQIIAQDRPRILFSSADYSTIRERIINGPTEVRDTWAELLADCNYFMTNNPGPHDGFSCQYLVIPKLGFAHLIQEGDPNGYGQRAVNLCNNIIIPDPVMDPTFNFPTSATLNG